MLAFAYCWLQEFNKLEGYQWGGFAAGCCIMFVGLYFLAPLKDEAEAQNEQKVCPQLRAPQ